MKEKKINKLVADSAAFIRNAQMQVLNKLFLLLIILVCLKNFCLLHQEIAQVVYTIRDVVEEIKDQATKQRLRVLPYEIKMMEPSPEAIVKGKVFEYYNVHKVLTNFTFVCIVTEFSKKTGDYATLSATDIKVLALTYQLEVDANGPEHIKTEPQIKKTVVVAPRPPSQGPVGVEKVAGFYMPKSGKVDKLAEEVSQVSIEDKPDCELPNNTQGICVNEESMLTSSTDNKSGSEVKNEQEKLPTEGEKDEKEKEEDGSNGSEKDDDEDLEEEEEEEEESDDDNNGWITPSNIQHVKNSMVGVTETVQLEVACLTTDFAMQVD